MSLPTIILFNPYNFYARSMETPFGPHNHLPKEGVEIPNPFPIPSLGYVHE